MKILQFNICICN